ncbi:unnamed protein product, partial [Mesorhabditis spiculigera]
MKLVLILLLLTAPVFSDFLDWQCGIGAISGRISYLLTIFSSAQRGINECCREHDTLIDRRRNGLWLTRGQIDRRFCQCLDNHDNFFVRWFIEPIFCAAVKIHSFFSS